jgi:hypothetical protein
MIISESIQRFHLWLPSARISDAQRDESGALAL